MNKLMPSFLAVSFVFLFSGVLLGQAPIFDLQKVTDGVYVAVARPQYKLNCNSAIIVNEDGVLVVDSGSKPSAARTLIAQITELTGKPVRYLVDTHFHIDHVQGNQAYPAAFPDVTIIATEATRDLIIAKGLQKEIVNHPSINQQIQQMPGEIEYLKKRLAAEAKGPGPLDQATQKELDQLRAKLSLSWHSSSGRLQGDLEQAEAYQRELLTMDITLPNLTVDKSLILHKRDRDIDILFLGRGHTAGDLFVYLPKQKVVATGDMVHAWLPYLNDSYPPEWVTTLDQLLKLDFDYVIGAHGEVKGKSQVALYRNYLADLITETRRAVQAGKSLQQAQESVASALAPNYQAEFPDYGAYAVGLNVEKVYSDMKAKKY
jgi:glyoxylase-like metal-dependent hydrolase (beta-lactamase superfamily II)